MTFVHYFWAPSFGWVIRCLGWNSTDIYPTIANESVMMIPGTFAEMHNDYD